jgi:hypothetical protein
LDGWDQRRKAFSVQPAMAAGLKRTDYDPWPPCLEFDARTGWNSAYQNPFPEQVDFK